MYGLFIDDIFPLAITSIVCNCIGLTYVIIFVHCTRDRRNALKKCAIFAVPLLLILLYAILAAAGATNQSHGNTGKVFGYMTIGMTAIFYTSPLLKIKHVLQTKSADVLPIALCCVGTTNNALWLSYGAIIGNWIIAGPNTFCAFFGIVQICLWAKYRLSRNTEEGTETTDDVRVSVEVSAANGKYMMESSLESPMFHAVMAPIGLSSFLLLVLLIQLLLILRRY